MESVSSTWCYEQWHEFAGLILFDDEVFRQGMAFARRSRTLAAWTVQGKLRGTGGREHFHMEFPVISKSVWRTMLIPAIVRRPGLLAQVLSGTIPAQMRDVFDEAGLLLVPRERVLYQCSCSEFRYHRACKHIPALLVQGGVLFQQDPLSLVEMRGIKREELVRLLQEAHDALFAPASRDVQRACELPADPALFWQGLPWVGDVPEPDMRSGGLFIHQLRMPDFAQKAHIAENLYYVYDRARRTRWVRR